MKRGYDKKKNVCIRIRSKCIITIKNKYIIKYTVFNYDQNKCYTIITIY